MNVCLDEHRLGALRWIVLRGPDREAFRALGEHTRAQRSLRPTARPHRETGSAAAACALGWTRS